MDKMANYAQLIKDILSGWSRLSAAHSSPEMESIVVFDDAHGEYLWLHVGQERGRYLHTVTVHARLRDGKIHIEEDWTEDGIATALIGRGVPLEDLYLAFNDEGFREPTLQTLLAAG